MSPETSPPPIEITDTVIRRLPALLVNQIAAGEVIERPASVVKELVENAIDAEATRIGVDLEGGGIELVRVSDDGKGIAADELVLALAPHATSKIHESEDLDRIATMGFRGEALASIASVSRLTIRSRAREAEHGAEIAASGDEVSATRPAAASVGTVIESKNLFFNTPARRKFLRTIQTERGRCLDWVRDLAMAHPGVGFRVTSDGDVKLDVPPNQGARERVVELLGKELEDQLLEVHYDGQTDSRGIVLWGLVGLPSVARATARAQHVFLNGRALRDKTVQHAIREAYRGLIEPGRYPTAVLMIDVPPGAVDVNVHPAKLEVRFRDQSMVHSAVLRSVRESLRRADLTPTLLDKMPGLGGAGRFGAEAILAGGGGAGVAEQRTISPEQFAEHFKRVLPGAGEKLDFEALQRALDPVNQELRAQGAREPTAAELEPLDSGDQAEPTPMATVKGVSHVMQVHQSYLVTQDERGLVIIDQHALHERVMFEKLLARVQSAGVLESQQLLTPAVVAVPRGQADRIDELAPLLAKLGIEAELLSPTSVGVRSFTSLLYSRGVEPEAFVAEVLGKLDSGFTPGSEEALHEVLDMMACKAAVKAGDRLSESEMAEIVSMRERVERSGSCPHGRPTTVRVTIAELEKLFDRR
ncbi:MAG: DNA mismatch repair protein MutL [Phycisphaerales bacterium]|jgi:DNA mismatch repair protein MutL